MFTLANGVKFVPVHRGINVSSSSGVLFTEFVQPNMSGCEHQIKVGDHDIGLDAIHHLAEVTPDVMALWLRTITENIGVYLKNGIITPNKTLGDVTVMKDPDNDDVITLERLGEKLTLTDSGPENIETFLNGENEFAFLTFDCSDCKHGATSFIYRIDSDLVIPDGVTKEDFYRPWLTAAIIHLAGTDHEYEILKLKVGKLTIQTGVRSVEILVDSVPVVVAGSTKTFFGDPDVNTNSLDRHALSAFMGKETKIPVSYCLPEFFTRENIKQIIQRHLDNPDAPLMESEIPTNLQAEIINAVVYSSLTSPANQWIGEVVTAMGERSFLDYAQLSQLTLKRLSGRYSRVEGFDSVTMMKYTMAVQAVLQSWYTQK